MWDILLFRNVRSTIVIVELFAATLMFAGRLNRRKFVVPRLTAGFAVIFAVMIGWNYLAQLMLANSHSERLSFIVAWFSSIGTYGILFTLTFCSILFSFKDTPYDALFCCVAGYCVQHATFSGYTAIVYSIDPDLILLRIYSPITFVKVAIYVGFYLLSYTAAYFTFASKTRKYSEIHVSKRMLVLLGAVLIINMFVGKLGEVYTGKIVILYVALLVCQITACIMVLALQFFWLQHLQYRRDREVMLHILDQQADQFKFSKANFDLMNIRSHDLKHQIGILRAGGDAAEALLADIENEVRSYESIIKTDSNVLNIILSEKALYCRKHRIKLSCIADPDTLGFVDPVDAYSLIGNAVDNAIDAVMKCRDKNKRVVSVSLTLSNGFACIQTTNYFENELVIEDGLPVSNKDDKSKHGYGIKSIKHIAEKYGGNISFKAEDGIFTLQIVFTVPNSGKDSKTTV